MPNLPLHPCNNRGCHRLTSGRYCEHHTKQAMRDYDREREGTEDRKIMHSAHWRKVRARKLDMNPLCERCEQTMNRYVPAVIVHHIDGDRHNESDDNLKSCCVQCHETLHGSRFK